MVNCKAITYRIRLTTTKYTFRKFPIQTNFYKISIGISTLKKKKRFTSKTSFRAFDALSKTIHPQYDMVSQLSHPQDLIKITISIIFFSNNTTSQRQYITINNFIVNESVHNLVAENHPDPKFDYLKKLNNLYGKKIKLQENYMK